MLGKLIKHEWKATRRLMLPVNLAILMITLAGCGILSTNIFDNENAMPLAVFLTILYIFSLFALGMVTTVYLLIRFYKNLFTREGYLMFTLPATPIQLLNAKLVTGYIWALLNTCLTILSIGALGFSAGYHSARFGSPDDKIFSNAITYQINGVTRELSSFEDVIGYSLPVFLLLLLGILLIGCFASLTMGYLSIVLGQLVEKYKLACSIAFYIAFSIIMQIANSIIMIVANIGHIIHPASNDFIAVTRTIYGSLLPISGILNLIFGFLFYFVTIAIMKKKINLD